MTIVIKASLFICLALGLACNLQAQEFSSAFKESTINDLAKLLNDLYVSPDVAKKTSEHLSKQLKTGHFDSAKSLELFAKEITNEAQSISKDKHMLIRPVRMTQEKVKENSLERIFERQLHRLASNRNTAGGFKEAALGEGNVGYLDIRSFAPLHTGSSYADAYMKLLSTSDAIIIDLRENGGGYPEMVQYLCSYFFDKQIHLNSLYWREGDRTQEFWTLDKVNGKKLPDVPLFVLTSSRTFSGAEEFAYNMQTQERATLVGETTRGGANPGRVMRINEKLEAIIPIGKAVNPITGTNWEGVGVTPDVKTSPEKTLARAYELAKSAGQEYSARLKKNQLALSADLIKSLESFGTKTDEDSVFDSLKKCVQAGLLESRMINGLGYEHLWNFKKPELAEAIFKSNTRLYPETANAFDSYAEVLGINGKLKESAINYRKAVEIAKATNDPELQLFEENLAKASALLQDQEQDN